MTDEQGIQAATSDGADLLDLIQDSVILRDPAGRILAWNRASEALYGWPRDRAVGLPVHDLLQTGHAEPLAALEARLAETGTWQGELTRRHATGREILVESRWVLRQGGAGRPLQVVESGRDVTARRGAEEALRHSEHRYHNLFQAMAASFWELDFFPVGDMLRQLRIGGVTDFAAHFASHPGFVREMMRATRVLDVNQQTVSLFGHGDRVGLLGCIEPFWPEASTPVFAAAVLAAVTRQPHYVTETRLRTLQGREFDSLFTACFPPATMNRGSLLVGVIDIDARKRAERDLQRSEARYRSLFQGAAVAFWELDFSATNSLLEDLRRSGLSDFADAMRLDPGLVDRLLAPVQVVDVNDRSRDLFGGARREDLLGPVARFLPDGSGTVLAEAFGASFHGQPVFEAETRLLTLDGREIDVMLTASAPTEARDNGTVLVGLIDISDQVAARAGLARRQADLAHAARVAMLGELTASIAHEINQPLAAIATNGAAGLRWLDRATPDVAEVRALTARVVADADRAAAIIARIRRMAMPGPPERRPQSLNRLVGEALQFLAHALDGQEILVTRDFAEDLPDLAADRTQLQQVVVNLVMNAMQAMDGLQPTERRLAVRTGRDGDGRLLLLVEDAGPGIAADHLPRLFDNFFTTRASGMGMGLPICRTIVEAHGGAIAACNRPQRGACLTVTLPPA